MPQRGLKGRVPEILFLCAGGGDQQHKEKGKPYENACGEYLLIARVQRKSRAFVRNE